MSNIFINYLKHIGLIANIDTTKRGIEIGCSKLNTMAKIPSKAHTGKFEDAAFDLFASEDILLQPTHREMVGTGIRFIIPDGYWIKLRERSGLANKGIHVLGGVIDSGYTGEVKVILYNSSTEPVHITRDKAICQFTVERLNLAYIEELDTESFGIESCMRLRSDNGFGSTDVKHK